MAEIKFDYAQVGGVRLHYATAGDGENLVLLLHGFPEFWYSWRHQIHALSENYTVVAPDLRGFNLSDKPKHIEDYDMDNIVDDITGLIRHFGRERAAVIGHDWGAAAAWATAQKYPEYVWKLGALQIPPPSVFKKNFSFRQLLASWYMFFFQIPMLPEFLIKRNDFATLAEGLKNSSVRKGVFTEKDIAEYKKAWSQPHALTSMLNYYRANVLKRFFTDTKNNVRIKVPTVFIYGEQDRVILPETVKNISELMDADYQEFHVPTSAHWVQQEVPEVVTEILRDFLAK